MPWNDNDNNKPKNNKNYEFPWGNPGKKNSNNEFSDLFKNSGHKFFRMLNDNNNSNRFLIIIIGVFFSLWLLTGFYNVSQEEQAVVLRFGKFVRLANPGLNYHIPEPFESVIILKVDRIEEEQIGFRASNPGLNVGSAKNLVREVPEESSMLTGDENLVNIHYTVQWNIKDIKDYIFNVKRPKETVKNAAESAMREVMGNSPIMAAFEERSEIETEAKQILQDILDSYKSGIAITSFSIQDADPPAEVADAFRDVQTALSDKEREINQAQSYQNDIIPRARGEASKIINDAEGYKQSIVSIATGEASRFNSILNQYKNAKFVTKQRMYLETMEDILKDIDKTILDKDIEKSVLPYFQISSSIKQ